MSDASPLFAMPRDTERWGGAAALWVTVAGWAGAVRRAGSTPVIVTPTRTLSEQECLDATARTVATVGQRRIMRIAPQWTKQLVRDVQQARLMRSVDSRPHLQVLADSNVPFVWRHHELFHTTGAGLAASRHAPVIEYLHAPVVAEARRWGVRRPVSGGLLERWGEAPQLRAADVVACVSEEVAHDAERLGVRADRIVVAPMAVDPERFHPDVDASRLREEFHTIGDFVFGWVGSFRKFHAMDQTVIALRTLRDQGCRAGLVLVGDGPDRARIEEMATELGVHQWVRFHGQCNHLDMPTVLAALDAATLTASKGQEFHYSPLKLREYLASGLPVVAPQLGEMARLLDDEKSALLYEAGDPNGLAEGLARLAQHPELRVDLGREGRNLVLAVGTWDAVVRSTLERLGM
ncbi:MAG: hypothetical protein RI900_1401 [Actinomycetota bacterium]|jgi:glycosyltransferase involved in cell wall biosynthesis